MSGNGQDSAKHAMARNLPKRFYKTVRVGGGQPPFSILADERSIKTPMKVDLAVPFLALAEAVAGEWDAQLDVIDPARMPLTRLCNTALDRVSVHKPRIVQEITDFAASDLVCYRADSPEGLVLRQQEVWDPVLQFMADRLGVHLVATTGLMHATQPQASLQLVGEFLGRQDPFALTAIHNITTLTGSCAIALAVHESALGGDMAWSAAHIDEDWQIEHWGEDDEARARRAANRAEFDAAVELLELLRAASVA
ncbi:MAG: ATP12 family chaperone protein [Aestuariivirgaceae bacterium]